MLDLRSPRDYIPILKRRKSFVIVPLILGVMASLSVALLWPPTYRSIASVLIEEPDVPRDLVNSTVTSYADERIQVINQRVLTTDNLTSIIEKHSAYEEARDLQPMSIVIEGMREDIQLDLIGADVRDPRSGRSQEATIAFRLAFDYSTPEMAQRVLSELISLYLGENLRMRRNAAAETTGFLNKEAEEYENQIKELEQELANFKALHSGSLPEQIKVKTQMRDRLENDLIRLQTQLQSLEERRIFIEAQLAQVDPNTGPEWDPVLRLRMLQSQYISLKSKYGSNHPDVREAEREIKALEIEIGPGGSYTALDQTRQAIEAELANLRKNYSEAHPDVVRLKRELENVTATLAKTPVVSGSTEAAPPTNPTYIQLTAQLTAINSQANALIQQRSLLQTKFQQFEEDILAGPEIEREYLDVRRNYENAVNSFNDVKERLTRAELGESLEAESKSERFSLIEPPNFPIRPVSPNRPAVLVLGIIISLLVGTGLAIFVEMTDDRVYGPRQFSSVTGTPPLVVVAKIQTAEDNRRYWGIRTTAFALTCTAIVALLIALDSLVMPLDVLWAVIERRWDGFFLNVSQG
jgi:uncharacterized protein involved in exopolysaccharide biosynthesis